MPWDAAYSISVAGRSFHMFTNEVSILRGGPRAPGGSISVNAGGELALRLVDRPDGEVVDIFRRDIEDLYPEAAGIVREAIVQRWRYPYPRPGRHSLQPALEQPLGRLFLAGDYLDSDYAGMEVAAASGLRAARGARAVVGEGAASGASA
jgi:oxygen-dependent protoporphyrinogen oxidase